MEPMKVALAARKDMFINLDQNPQVQSHYGAECRVNLASGNVMWAVLRERPLTPLDSRQHASTDSAGRARRFPYVAV